jgi:hypothetical protein
MDEPSECSHLLSQRDADIGCEIPLKDFWQLGKRNPKNGAA